MELLLNLFWLLLALTVMAAGWMASHARVSRLGRVVLVGCICLLAFPIVSASDDLRALAIEYEDAVVSTPGALKHAKSHGLSCQNDGLAFSCAHASNLIPSSEESWNQVRTCTSQLPMQGSARPTACRPPPGRTPLVLVASATMATPHRLAAASPSSDGVEAALAAAQKERCLDPGERHGEHGFTNRADNFGDPLPNWQESSTTRSTTG